MSTPSDSPDPSGSAHPARRSPWRRRALIGLGVLAAAGLVFCYVVVPYPWTLRSDNPEQTSLMKQRVQEASARNETLEIQHEWVSLDDIAPSLLRAVVIAEDYRFRQHAGIDWVSLAEEVEWTGDDDFSWRSREDRRALVAALRYVWTSRSELKGRSTITQQLAKNLYFGTDRSLARKGMEFVVARRLEKRLDKDRILELYLNIAEWGPGVFGAEAAAQAYFGRPASRLTVGQAAALAGTLPHPLTSNPARNPSRMLWRKDLILRRMDPALAIPPAPIPLAEPTFESEITPRDTVPVDTIGASVDTVLPPVDTVLPPVDTILSPVDTILPPVDTTGL